MSQTVRLTFAPFAIDLATEQLWHGEQLLPLRPKPFAILRYLVEHPSRLVTKEELLKAIWPQTYVSEGLLHTYLRDLRHVLNDDPEAPRFIETVVRRGYRFIAPLFGETTSESPPSNVRHGELARPLSPVVATTASLRSSLVGREAVLSALYERLEQARTGKRQLVFVTGEPGIGKTTLVDAFLEQVSAAQHCWIGRGQCVAQYGAGEAYLPILEALGRLCREAGGEQLVTLLRRQAPSWLAQLPALLADGELETLQRAVHGVTRERMLRELVEAFEVLTAERPLILVLEDLHWSDVSTVDLLAVVARRREAARLLVLGTYRPAEVIVSGHPLRAVKQELDLHRQCTELPLTFLVPDHIAQYLSVRFPRHQFPAALAQLLHQHTEGNPLFLVNTVEDLVAQQVMAEHDGQWRLQASLDEIALGVPSSVQQLIVRQLERLSVEEQRIIEVASVAGESFSTAAVAAGLELELERVEASCESLARREHFLQARDLGTWPDGTVAGSYQFVHALYQQVGYERIGAARRVQLHRRIGAGMETAYGGQAKEIAAELAMHFEQGRDYRRAMQYYEHAGKNAIRRSAHKNAIDHLTKGLTLLKTLPETSERVQSELTLQIALGAPLIATKGYSAAEVGQVYSRARELCQQLGELPELFPTLYGLTAFSVIRGKLQTAHELNEQLLRLAHSTSDSAFLVMAHRALGTTLVSLGEFASAQEHFQQGLAVYDPLRHRSLMFVYGIDPKLSCLSFLVQTSWYLGYPEQALRRSQEVLSWAQELAHPYGLGGALYNVAWLHHQCGDVLAMQAHAEAAIALATEQGFALLLALHRIGRGWALAEQKHLEEGMTEMNQGLVHCRAVKISNLMSYHLALLGEVYGKAGKIADGLTAVAEGLATADNTGERTYEAELYRLQGELTLQQARHKSQIRRQKSLTPDPQGKAEACFLKAIEVAQKQQAKSLELRAVMSLSRLWHQQGKRKQAHHMLSEIYNWFTEGFDTKDLQEAKALLDELA